MDAWGLGAEPAPGLPLPTTRKCASHVQRAALELLPDMPTHPELERTMTDFTHEHRAVLTSHRSPYAPALLAAYAAGATLWAPVLVLCAKSAWWLLAGLVPGIPAVGNGWLIAMVWAMRFALYLLGSANGWNYGYGINGVIVNRRLSLAEKARRVTRDWFGVLLILVWTGWMVTLGCW
jgi:hypothetical protein